MKNPHFDEGLVVWGDEYLGYYKHPSTSYSEQFDLEWALSLDDKSYDGAVGASKDDEDIDDRIYEWIGVHLISQEYRDRMLKEPESMVLDLSINMDLIRGKDCIDLGCGLGRWLKVMLALVARSVLFIDMSESALKSVSSFNRETMRLDIMKIQSAHPELVDQFDFANLWLVAQHTHDPSRAFMNAAPTVKPGGVIYLIVYAPEGINGLKATNIQRNTFHRLNNLEDRLTYVDHVRNREWDNAYPLLFNIRNQLRNILRRTFGSKINFLDLLAPFYNWVIPQDVIYGWMDRAGI
jgi:SAM-dependent methyltransferase